jgi:hypothetical protein
MEFPRFPANKWSQQVSALLGAKRLDTALLTLFAPRSS